MDVLRDLLKFLDADPKSEKHKYHRELSNVITRVDMARRHLDSCDLEDASDCIMTVMSAKAILS